MVAAESAPVAFRQSTDAGYSPCDGQFVGVFGSARPAGTGPVRRSDLSLVATNALIDRAIHGEAAERGELLERLRPRLVLWAASRLSGALRDKINPDDLAQEVLLAMHRGFDGFAGQGPGELFAWMFTIAENKLRDTVDYFGAKKRQPIELKPFSETSPAERAARAEQLEVLRRAVERLPEDYRTVIRLVRFEEKSAEVAGVELERSANAVRLLYFRAVRALRAELAPPDE